MKGTIVLKKLSVLSLLLAVSLPLAHASNDKDPKSVVMNVFRMLIENPNWTKADFERLISKDYIQVADGNRLNYEQDLAHLEVLRKECKSIRIVFHDIVVQGNKVATRHTAHAIKKDGSQLEADVVAIFEVKDGKLFRCDELTRLVKGNKADADLGSRT
jgi:ketosteroid isomerase-like protein